MWLPVDIRYDWNNYCGWVLKYAPEFPSSSFFFFLALWPCKHIQAELAAIDTLHVEGKKTAIVSESIWWITKLPKKPLGLLISV